MTHLTVRYFAQLREKRGCAEEELDTDAQNPRDLYAELSGRYPFGPSPDHLKVAVNDRMAGWDTPLNDGDSVLFIPPVAGG